MLEKIEGNIKTLESELVKLLKVCTANRIADHNSGNMIVTKMEPAHEQANHLDCV